MKRFVPLIQFCLLTLLTLCTVTCSHPTKPKTFPQEYRLTSVHYPIGSHQVRDMEIKNGFILLCMRNSSFRIHSVKDYSFVSAFEGKQTEYPFKVNQIIKSSSPYLYIMNVNYKNEIRKYQIDSLGRPMLLQTGFTGVSNSMNRPYIVCDSLILYDEFIPEASLKIHNLHSNSEERALHYGTTSLQDRFTDKNMGGLYANDSCIIFVYKYQDRIDFYDWRFNLIQSQNHQKFDPIIYPYERSIAKLPPKNVLYYGNSYIGQNYFYTLYRGVTNKVFHSDSISIHNGMNYIYGITRDIMEVYELDGRPVCRYHFDDVSPAVFIVDEEQNRLIGYREAYDDVLLVYPLQGLPKNGQKYSESVTQHYYSSLPATPEPEKPKEFIHNVSMPFFYDISPIFFVFMSGQDIYFPVPDVGNLK